MNWKFVVGGVTIGYAVAALWLHEHDKAIRMQAKLDQMAVEQTIKDDNVKGLILALEQWNVRYKVATQRYERSKVDFDKSLHNQQVEINSLTDRLFQSAPDSLKQLVTAVKEACDNRVKSVIARLETCDNLRRNAIDQLGKTQLLMTDITTSRDSWKHLFETQRDAKHIDGVWSTVGKVTTGAAFLATITKLLGWW